MQTRLGISSVVLVLSTALSVQTTTACPRESVAAAVERWTTVFAENNPDTITALYSKDVALWGTLSPTLRSDPAALRAYFVGLPGAAKGHRQIRRSADPNIWRHRGQHGLLHVFLHDGR
jgi:hypothetical protein